MAFPHEAEESIRRSILKSCQEHARIIVEMSRKLVLIFESQKKNNKRDVKKHYAELFKLIEQFEEDKKRFLEEVATAGGLLIEREDFLRLIFKFNEIADSMEGVAFRLLNCNEKQFEIGKKYFAKASKISNIILDEISTMRETLLSLSFNPAKALEMALIVEKIEKDVDSNYRELIGKVLESEMPVQLLLILKDIIERLESIADLTLDAIDLIRLLAISG